MADKKVVEAEVPACGIVMPISEIEGCSALHWSEVQKIISDSARSAGFTPKLVSESDDIGVIQKRIIENLYDNPIVVCDVSCKNPNVMFELGMRLAFDKPTILIKDDQTPFSFDTSPIEHLTYPRDLHYPSIVEFKSKLSEKLKATHERANTDKDYTTFLKHFGAFTVAKLDKKELSAEQYILDELSNIRIIMSSLQRASTKSGIKEPGWEMIYIDVSPNNEVIEAVLNGLSQMRGISDVHIVRGTDGAYVRARFESSMVHQRAYILVKEIVLDSKS